MVAAATLKKQGNDLLNLYVQLYVEKYGKAPKMNRHKYSWGFKDMVEDYKFDRAKQIVEYYFTTVESGHPVDQLLYNYEKIEESLTDVEKDRVLRAELLVETEKRAREWRERNGNK